MIINAFEYVLDRFLTNFVISDFSKAYIESKSLIME